MNKVLLFLILIVNYSNAQEQIKKYNYASGVVKESGKIDKNGNPVGVWNYNSGNGALDYSINWKTNSFKKYYESGELKETGTFIPETGAHIGKWLTYYKNGAIETMKTFDKNGVKNGELKHFLKNGTLSTTEIYIKGTKQE